jgi:hypothetical protein
LFQAFLKKGFGRPSQAGPDARQRLIRAVPGSARPSIKTKMPASKVKRTFEYAV